MDTYVTIAIIISITLLFLAFMGMFIEVDIESSDKGKIPKIKFTFKKDGELYGFLKRGKGKKKENEQEESKGHGLDHGYYEKNYFAEALIEYGENSESIINHKVTMIADKEEVSYFVYRNIDSKAKVRCNAGFLDMPSSFQRICDLSSWDVCNSTGYFAGANKIYLPISRLRKGDTKRLEYTVKLKIGYREIQNSVDILKQAFYFRMGSDTDRALLKFRIPNGKKSIIEKFILNSSIGSKRLFNMKITNNDEDIIFLCKNGFGNGWIEKGAIYTTLYWNIPSKLKLGQVCELEWYITAKRDN